MLIASRGEPENAGKHAHPNPVINEGCEHVILHKLFGHVASQRAMRVMADKDVTVSAPVTVHGVVVGT